MKISSVERYSDIVKVYVVVSSGMEVYIRYKGDLAFDSTLKLGSNAFKSVDDYIRSRHIL